MSELSITASGTQRDNCVMDGGLWVEFSNTVPHTSSFANGGEETVSIAVPLALAHNWRLANDDRNWFQSCVSGLGRRCVCVYDPRLRKVRARVSTQRKKVTPGGCWET